MEADLGPAQDLRQTEELGSSAMNMSMVPDRGVSVLQKDPKDADSVMG